MYQVENQSSLCKQSALVQARALFGFQLWLRDAGGTPVKPPVVPGARLGWIRKLVKSTPGLDLVFSRLRPGGHLASRAQEPGGHLA